MTYEEYLKLHSINQEFASEMGWSFDQDKMTINIPILDSNENFLFNKYRHIDHKETNKDSKYTQDRGAHPSLYCSHKIKNHNRLVLCEGEPDCVRLWQEEIPSITTTGGVKTIDPEIFTPLRNKTILITLDTDKAGFESIQKYYETLISVGAKPLIKELPSKYKDVSEYFTDGYARDEFLNLPELTLEEWLEKHEPEEFEWETTDQILKEDIPLERWLIDKVVPVSGFCFWVGSEATAKSLHALLIAKSIITGNPYLDKFEVKQQTNILIIDKENSKRRIQDRLRGFEINGINSEYKIHYLRYPQFFEIADKSGKSTDGFTDFIKSVSRKVRKYNIGLIIVDSFTDVLTGDENDRDSIQDFVSAFKQLFPDISYFVLHHAGKIQMGNRRPSSQMIRGSTNIMAQAYTAFHTETVRKSKTEFTVEQTKAGDSLKMNKFGVELKVEPDPLNTNETLVKDLIYKGDVLEKEEKIDEAVEEIESQFSEIDRISRKELHEILVSGNIVTNTTFNKATKILIDNGKMISEKSLTVKGGKDFVWMKQGVDGIYVEV